MIEEKIEELIEIEAIKRLKARYFRLMDTKCWDELAELFTPDIELDVPENGRIVQGRDEVMGIYRKIVHLARTVHHGHMPEIELLSPTSATGIWAMFDYVEFPSEDERPGGLRGFGHYHETYEKADGAWRISSLKLTRLRVDSLS
ncbi:MAG: nuclear transport factor 2 family protein [Planctomycetota bacterium]|jgi:hypothetical protein